MPADFELVFSELKGILKTFEDRLALKTDTSKEYTLVTKSPSTFPQHKGEPLYFASIRLGKAYVSFHLVPLYMNPVLTASVSPELKKRMQGKACFNFKVVPDDTLLVELTQLTETGFNEWAAKNWT